MDNVENEIQNLSDLQSELLKIGKKLLDSNIKKTGILDDGKKFDIEEARVITASFNSIVKIINSKIAVFGFDKNLLKEKINKLS